MVGPALWVPGRDFLTGLRHRWQTHPSRSKMSTLRYRPARTPRLARLRARLWSLRRLSWHGVHMAREPRDSNASPQATQLMGRSVRVPAIQSTFRGRAAERWSHPHWPEQYTFLASRSRTMNGVEQRAQGRDVGLPYL